MATPLVQQNFQKLLEPGLRSLFHSELDAQAEYFMRTKLFGVETSQRAWEEHHSIGALDAANGWDIKKSGTLQYDDLGSGYSPIFRHRPFAKGMMIERELIDDNLYPGAKLPRTITERPERLARAAELFRELVAADMFNGAFTDTGVGVGGFSYTGIDGVGLCSTAHKFSASSSTYSNEGTTAFSKAALTATRLAGRSMVDARGQLSVVNYDTLIIPPELEEDAEVVTGSALDPTSANNAINTTGKRVKQTIVWDYLTSATSWFLGAGRMLKDELVWYDRIMPEFAGAGDFDTMMAKFRVYMRFSRGWRDPRVIYGQKPV